MSAAHSPAPFTVRDDKRSPASIEAADGDCIAKVYLTNPVTKKRDAEHAANLALVLAAPAMLESLKWAVAFFDDPHRILDSRRLDKARAAIAAAEGKP